MPDERGGGQIPQLTPDRQHLTEEFRILYGKTKEQELNEFQRRVTDFEINSYLRGLRRLLTGYRGLAYHAGFCRATETAL